MPSALYRGSDPATSREAAASIRDMPAMQACVYATLLQIGPATDEELFRELRDIGVLISDSGARTRRHELEARGLVRDSGLSGRTVSGRKATVWEAVPTTRSGNGEAQG